MPPLTTVNDRDLTARSLRSVALAPCACVQTRTQHTELADSSTVSLGGLKQERTQGFCGWQRCRVPGDGRPWTPILLPAHCSADRMTLSDCDQAAYRRGPLRLGTSFSRHGLRPKGPSVGHVAVCTADDPRIESLSGSSSRAFAGQQSQLNVSVGVLVYEHRAVRAIARNCRAAS